MSVMRMMRLFCVLLLLGQCLRSEAQPTGFVDQPIRSGGGSKTTLLVIFGKIRTLSLVAPSVIHNLITPNLPCKVVLAFDLRPETDPNKVLGTPNATAVQAIFKPWLLETVDTMAEPIPRHVHRRAHIEMYHMYVVLQKVKWQHFGYIIATRSDVWLRLPICVRCLYGDVLFTTFASHFSAFSNSTARTLARDIPSGMMAFLYLMAGGQVGFLRRSLTFGKVHYIPDWHVGRFPHSENAHLRTQLEAQIPNNASVGLVYRALRNITKQQKVTFLVGNTWIRFGSASTVAVASRSACEQYSHLVTDPWRPDWDYWRFITESQLRLAYYTHGLGLIDVLVEESDSSGVGDHDCQFAQRVPDMLTHLQRSMCCLVRPCFPKAFQFTANTTLPATVQLQPCAFAGQTACI